MFRIGWLSSQPPAPPGTAYRGGPYVQRLSELGYIEGKHFEFVVRLGNGDPGKLPALAEELVRAGVDVIVAAGDKAADAVRDQRIPVVATTCQPFEAITKLVRDGRNLTGITCMTSELAPKRLEFFRQALPRARRLALLHNPNESYGGLEIFIEQAKVFGIVLEPVPVPDAAALEGALASIARSRPDGITHQPSQVLARAFQRMAEFALKEKLPMIGPFSELAKFGGLMTYGAAGPELPHTAAEQTDRILRGGKPREMPVEQAKRIHLTINLKTAKALGLTIPQSLLIRADEVIQ
jgi:putative ABC transport system substrate-binding protein